MDYSNILSCEIPRFVVTSIRFKIKNLNQNRSYDMNRTYEIRTESVKIGPGLDGYFAYPVLPGNYPGIVVCMEIFGVTEHMRNIAERLAKQGYITFVPNFYWHTRPSADLPHDVQGREEGMHLMKQLHRESVLEDVTTTMTFLRNDGNCSGRIGIVGFSLGGHIAYLAATQLNLEAAASFYGGWIVNGGIPLSSPNPTIFLTEGMAQRDVRLLGIVGGQDHLISAMEWEQLKEALIDAGVRHELIVYPEAKHGFFCDLRRETFDQTASDDAWWRLLDLFEDELRR